MASEPHRIEIAGRVLEASTSNTKEELAVTLRALAREAEGAND